MPRRGITTPLYDPTSMSTPPLTREDVLLLIADGATGAFPLDPIRLMKGAFLVSDMARNRTAGSAHCDVPFWDRHGVDQWVVIEGESLAEVFTEDAPQSEDAEIPEALENEHPNQ